MLKIFLKLVIWFYYIKILSWYGMVPVSLPYHRFVMISQSNRKAKFGSAGSFWGCFIFIDLIFFILTEKICHDNYLECSFWHVWCPYLRSIFGLQGLLHIHVKHASNYLHDIRIASNLFISDSVAMARRRWSTTALTLSSWVQNNEDKK